MQGFPKHLNNRNDYEYVRANFPTEQWMPAWRWLLETRFVWRDTKELSATAKGKANAVNRVFAVGGKRMQQELVEDEMALIFRLGFTVAEVEGALAGV